MALHHLNPTLLARGAAGPLTSASWPTTNELKQHSPPAMACLEAAAWNPTSTSGRNHSIHPAGRGIRQQTQLPGLPCPLGCRLLGAIPSALLLYDRPTVKVPCASRIKACAPDSLDRSDAFRLERCNADLGQQQCLMKPPRESTARVPRAVWVLSFLNRGRLSCLHLQPSKEVSFCTYLSCLWTEGSSRYSQAPGRRALEPPGTTPGQPEDQRSDKRAGLPRPAQPRPCLLSVLSAQPFITLTKHFLTKD